MVAEVAERYLRRDGFSVRTAHDGAAALVEIDRFEPDLLILDLMLPGLDGWEICRRVRARAETPIIMLTARSEEVDKLLGLELGADDYVTKPFSPRELVARTRAVLRRTGGRQLDRDALRFDDLRLNARTRVAEDNRGPISLTAREFDLLFHLARHAGQVLSREQLLATVWDIDFAGDASTVTVHIRRLREKIEADPSRPRHIKTVWGVGYKFDP